MNWIERYYEKNIDRYLKDGKVLMIYGPRRSGKTSLIVKVLEGNPSKVFKGTGDDLKLRQILSSEDKNIILNSFSDYDLVFIDEAQKIINIGVGLKILTDHLPNQKIIATGSSSFTLSKETGSALTGRQNTIVLFPISILELKEKFGGMEIIQQLQDLLIYGVYPETITSNNYNEKRHYLNELVNSYLFKDIFELENIRNPLKIVDLLKLAALQIGNEVSINELSNQLGLAKQTIERYLDLLEKSFIIKRIGGFSRNLRKEITKSYRYYFYDNGVRNAIINNFNDLNSRIDSGMLWENFCFIERIKKQNYHSIFSNNYFWRTYDQQEIDLIEERDGNLHACEFKWSSKKKVKPPKAWRENYPNASFHVITPENLFDFLT